MTTHTLTVTALTHMHHPSHILESQVRYRPLPASDARCGSFCYIDCGHRPSRNLMRTSCGAMQHHPRKSTGVSGWLTGSSSPTGRRGRAVRSAKRSKSLRPRDRSGGGACKHVAFSPRETELTTTPYRTIQAAGQRSHCWTRLDILIDRRNHHSEAFHRPQRPLRHSPAMTVSRVPPPISRKAMLEP